jgi:hypothetical protein
MKGVESNVNKELLDALKNMGIALEEGKAYSAIEITTAISAAWEKKTQEQMDVIKASATPLVIPESFMTKEQVTEKLGKELSADEVLKLAKEGQSYREELVKEALKMGVRAQGESFKQETWERNFALMEVQDIKDTMNTWEAQAKAVIPAGRVTDPAAGQGNTSLGELPDEAYKVK